MALPIENALDVYIAVLGEGANVKALELVQALRQQGFKAERDYLDRKLKAQFKSADVFAAKTLITLGESGSRKRTSDSQEQPNPRRSASIT